MDLGFRGAKAIVTGGSKGIGREIALTLAREGADVAICARGKEGVDATVAELQGIGVRAMGDAVDVTDADGFAAWIASAIERLGGLDTIVFNASVQPQGDDDATWQISFESDVMQTVRALRVAQPALAESSIASVIVISSTNAISANVGPGQIAYGSLKAALISMASKLAVTLGRDGIRVNTVTPGCISFEGGTWDKLAQMMPQMVEGVAKSTMVGRLGHPEEIANAVAFLASPRASYVTGANLRVDGGLIRAVDF
jgi:3-oxoacyl-[acyl-carrier protein] reductase